jgi:hypothetical protein
MKILRGIYWNEDVINNSHIIIDLVKKKSQEVISEEEIKDMKNKINFVYGLLRMKEKLKRY